MEKDIKQKNNSFIKILKIVENIIFYIFMAIMIVLIFFLIQSRMTGDVPSIGSYRMYIVESGSMTPTIKVGSLVIVKEVDANDIDSGDVITYRGLEDTVVTHRVVKIKKDDEISFITKGDANETKDPLPLNESHLIGKSIFWVPYIGVLMGFIRTKTGFITLIVVPLILLIIIQFYSRYKRKKGNDV